MRLMVGWDQTSAEEPRKEEGLYARHREEEEEKRKKERKKQM